MVQYDYIDRLAGHLIGPNGFLVARVCHRKSRSYSPTAHLHGGISKET